MILQVEGSDVLKLGIVGVGGRGSGPVGDAMQAGPNIKLVAACDVFHHAGYCPAFDE